MLTKALEEIAKKAIDKISSSKHGWVLLVLFTVSIGGYFLIREARTTPEATATLADPRFVTLIWATGTAAACYAIWYLLAATRIARAGALVFTLLGSAVGWWRVVDLEPPPLRIDVLFDSGDALPTKEAADFFATLQQSYIVITMVYRDLPALGSGDRLEFGTARNTLWKYLRPESQTTHTALVTSKHLSGAGWQNLFYVTSPRFSVISTYGLLPEAEKERRDLLRKYLAAMVPLVAMRGQALSTGKKILKDRDPATEHGCLHDFSVDKPLMMEKLKRGPKMCAVEDAELSDAFGLAIASEYRAILASAAAASTP